MGSIKISTGFLIALACFSAPAIESARATDYSAQRMEAQRKMAEFRARHGRSDEERRASQERIRRLHDTAPKLEVGESIHWGRSGQPLYQNKKWTDGAPDIKVTSSQFTVPLYPGNVKYTSFGQSGPAQKSSQEKNMQFWTRDSVNQVYGFYVGNLKRQGWRFLKSSTSSEIQAALPGRNLGVSIKYKALPAPYKGTAVAVSEVWSKSGTPERIISLNHVDMNKRNLERWWRGN